MATIQEAMANALKNKGVATPMPTATDTLPDPLKSLRDKLRADYGDQIAAFTDLQVLQTYQDWSLSSEAQEPSTFVEWLNDKYGTTATVSMADNEAQAESGRLSLEEIQRRVAANEITSHEAIELLTENGHLQDDEDEVAASDEDDNEVDVVDEDDSEETLDEDYDPDGAQAGDRYAAPDDAESDPPVDEANIQSIDELTADEIETMYQEGMITESERDNFLLLRKVNTVGSDDIKNMVDTLDKALSDPDTKVFVIDSLGTADMTDQPTKQRHDTMHPVPEERPMLVNPMEDLTQRQTLSVIADHLKTRRQEELFSVLGDILGRVYKMEAITESDVMVALADNVRLVDFVVAMTREVGIEPAMPKNHIIPVNVESSSVIFKPRKTRYNMTDLESAMVNAIGRIRNHMKIAEKVDGLEQKVKSLENDLRTANMATKAANEAAERAASALTIERQKPAPVPAVLRNKTGAVVVSWSTDKVKTNKKTGVKTVTGTTRYYLAVAEGASLNAKGEMPTKMWRRTTDIAESILFDNAADGGRVIERITKNAKHLASDSGITEKVIQKMALLTVTTVPV